MKKLSAIILTIVMVGLVFASPTTEAFQRLGGGVRRGTQATTTANPDAGPVYIPASRESVILFVEDHDGGMGPATKPDPNWQTVLNNLMPGQFGWYATTAQGQNGPDQATMQPYQLVIWNCYDSWQANRALTPTDQTNIANYLAGGGKVWLIGQDIIYAGGGPFVTANFHVQSYVEDYLADAPSANIKGQAELSAVPTIGLTCDYAYNGFWSDELTPTAQAHNIIRDTDNNVYPCIAYPNTLPLQRSFWTIDGRGPNVWVNWEAMVAKMLEAFGVYEPPSRDVATLSINVPVVVPENTILNPTATVRNYGDSTETFGVTCQINPGAYSSTFNVVNLAPGTDLNITFPDQFTFASGFYTVTVYTQLTGDENPGNDTLDKEIEATNWLYYDDGLVDNAWAYYYLNNGWGVQFPVTKEWWVDSIAAHFWGTDWPSPGGTGATFRIYDGTSAPTNLRWELADTTIVRGAWNYFAVDTTQTRFLPGDNTFLFYIQTADYPNCPGLSIDPACESPAYMWQLVNGVFSVANQGGDWLLRIHVIPVPTGVGEWITLTPDALLFRAATLCKGRSDIQFTIPEATRLDLVVYDATGRLCQTLISGNLSAGTHSQSFDLNLPPGVYFYNLKTASGINIARKFLLVR